MKLKNFSTANVQTASRVLPTIAFDRGSGLFRINAAACKVIGIKENDKVELAQDEMKLENWFIYKSKDKGFELRKKPKVGSGLYFNNSKLAQLVMGSVPGFNKNSAKVYVRRKSLKYQGKILWSLDLSPLKENVG